MIGDLTIQKHVENKNVLLVGNSKTILDKDNSSLIDSFDFVVRFNLSIGYLNKSGFENMGTKCSAWVFAMCREWVCEKVYNESLIKPKHCIRYGGAFNIGENNLTLPASLKKTVHKELNIPENLCPTTGVAFLYFLINNCNCKSISLIGYDSFKNNNFYNTNNKANECHSLPDEANYLKSLISNGFIKLIT